MSESSQPVLCIGIDLGTTFSAIAKINRAGDPEIIANQEGQGLTASAVWNDVDNGKVIVGSHALNARGAFPDRVAAEFKRQMDKPEWRATLADRSLSAVELSSLVLRKLREDTSLVLGSFTKAVITVPAYFDDPRRKATKEAARLAGLEALDILNEPTAAALAYAKAAGDEARGTHLVFDLGGGTFDVTLVRIEGEHKVIELATEGNARLGGMDFDWCLALEINDRFRREKGIDLVRGMSALTDAQRRRRDHALGLEPGIESAVDRGQAFVLLAEAERMKRRLSQVERASLPVGVGANTHNVVVTRDEFERLIEPWVQSAKMLVELVLAQAKLNPSQIDSVILVGGSSRIPAFQHMLKQIFGRDARTPVQQDEAVVRGAAIRAAACLAAKPGVVIDVEEGGRKAYAEGTLDRITSKAYGTLAVNTVTSRKYNSIVIPKGTRIPAECTRNYRTQDDSQDSIGCEVTEVSDNDETDLDMVTMLHTDRLKLQPGTPGGTRIAVTFKLDESQMLECTFMDSHSGKTQTIRLREGDTKGPEASPGGHSGPSGLEGLEL